jgi:hypothetical protein
MLAFDVVKLHRHLHCCEVQEEKKGAIRAPFFLEQSWVEGLLHFNLDFFLLGFFGLWKGNL